MTDHISTSTLVGVAVAADEFGASAMLTPVGILFRMACDNRSITGLVSLADLANSRNPVGMCLAQLSSMKRGMDGAA